MWESLSALCISICSPEAGAIILQPPTRTVQVMHNRPTRTTRSTQEAIPLHPFLVELQKKLIIKSLKYPQPELVQSQVILPTLQLTEVGLSQTQKDQKKDEIISLVLDSISSREFIMNPRLSQAQGLMMVPTLSILAEKRSYLDAVAQQQKEFERLDVQVQKSVDALHRAVLKELDSDAIEQLMNVKDKDDE